MKFRVKMQRHYLKLVFYAKQEKIASYTSPVPRAKSVYAASKEVNKN